MFANEPAGAWRSPRSRRPHLLEVVAVVVGGALHVTWHYAGLAHRRDTVEAWARAFVAALRELIRDRRAPAVHPRLTVDDLGDALREVEFE